MIFFISYGFWCQSAVCKKFAASIQVCGDRALLAKVTTWFVSPN